MDRARQSLRRLLALLAAVCALGGQASGQSPGQNPGVPGPIFEPPPVEGVVGGQTSVPPFLQPPSGEEYCPPGPWQTGPTERPWLFRQFDLRHSTTHGRAMGPGQPLRGTSWLNRPVSISLDGGALLMGDRVSPNVRPQNDLLGAVGVGWDWDHYWGSQVRIAWSTPELLNTQQTSLPTSDSLFIADLSVLYYPWGDSKMRPYWRLGVGLTDVGYTNDFGVTQNDKLYTMPFGVGMKYQIRPNLAWRLEFMDNFAVGQNETSTLNNFTLTMGFEWRLGGPPPGYWAWAPRGGGW